MKIKIGKIFEVTRGNKITKWKVIEHPCFDALALVKDYGGMISEYTEEDNKHICGKTTLETAYEDAFLMS